MAKLVMQTSVLAVYYTGIPYLEKSVLGGLNMVNDTIYILDKMSAQRLLGKGIVVEVQEELPDVELDLVGNEIVDVPSILALSVGAHGAGAKDNEADMAAYKANEDGLKEPELDGEGLNLVDDSIVVDDADTTLDDTESDL